MGDRRSDLRGNFWLAQLCRRDRRAERCVGVRPIVAATATVAAARNSRPVFSPRAVNFILF